MVAMAAMNYINRREMADRFMTLTRYGGEMMPTDYIQRLMSRSTRERMQPRLRARRRGPSMLSPRMQLSIETETSDEADARVTSRY